MRTRLVALVLLASVGCTGSDMPTQPSAMHPDVQLARARRSAVDGDRASFMLLAASYGPDNGEMTNVECTKTYEMTGDSTQVSGSWYVPWSKYDNTGCIPIAGEGGGYDFYVGGNASIYAYESAWGSGTGIVADQTGNATLEHVPLSATVQLAASAWEWKGFKFWYWQVTRSDNSQYIVCDAVFERNADTDDAVYQANFKKCIWHWSGYCSNDPYLGTAQLCA